MAITMPKDWDEAYNNPSNYMPKNFVASGQVCRILNATCAVSKNGNPMLVLSYDIAEGEFKGYFQERFINKRKFNADAKWGCVAYYSIIDPTTGKTNRSFAMLMHCINESNPDKVEFDKQTRTLNESQFKNKLVGIVFGEEEFVTFDGSVKSVIKPRYTRSIQDIRNGNFTVPDKKCVDTAPQSISPVNNNTQGMQEVTDYDLPF